MPSATRVVIVLGLALASLAPQIPLVHAGKLRVLGVGNRRTPVLDAPTISEAGYPDLDHAGLIGVFGPRGMPLDLRKQVAADIDAAGSTGEISARLNSTAQLPAYAGPEELEKSVAEMAAKLEGAARTLEMKKKQ